MLLCHWTHIMGTCPQLSSLMFQEFCLSTREEKRISRGLRRRQELAGAEGPGASSASPGPSAWLAQTSGPALLLEPDSPKGWQKGLLSLAAFPNKTAASGRAGKPRCVLNRRGGSGPAFCQEACPELFLLFLSPREQEYYR